MQGLFKSNKRNCFWKKKMKIRHAKKGDVNKIYSLGKKIKELKFSRKNFHEKEEIEEWIKKPKSNILIVAEDNEKFAGFLYAKIVSCDWCMLDNLAVDKQFRGLGIGKLLLERLYKEAKKRKVYFIAGLVNVVNNKGLKYFENNGFKTGEKFIWVEKFLKNEKLF